MKVLAIGNSFSQDATRYLYGIARADGEKWDVANLYIGGCSLERHYRNMLSDERAYMLQYNGSNTNFYVSLKEALLNRAWDVVTLQQASHFSFSEDSYVPYGLELYMFVKKCVPKAKVLIHQTWAYEEGSDRLLNTAGFETPEAMTAEVVKCYQKLYETVGADGIIPSGEMFQSLLHHGIPKVHRDTFHASLGLGRYALGLLWYQVISGAEIADNGFCDFDEPVTDAEISIAKSVVGQMK